MAKNHWDTFALNCAREMGHQWRMRYIGDDPCQPADPTKPASKLGNGYASRSILGKLKEEGIEGAGQSYSRQFFPEFYTGNGLLARRALFSLDDTERQAVEAHFNIKGVPVKAKAYSMGWAVRTYWWRLNRAMEKLGRVLRVLETGQAVTEPLHKIAA